MKKNLLLLIILLFYSINTYSQGCNDAGFCSLGDMKAGVTIDSNKSEMIGSLTFRLGEKEAAITTLQAQFNLRLSNSTKLSFQVPFQFIAGNLGFVTGLGDVSPSITQNIYSAEKKRISITVAGRIPSNESNLEIDTIPLPMAYQISQGTWDGIVGVNYFISDWKFSLAYQHNFNSNNNNYIDTLYNDSNTKYFDSRKIDRGDDVLFRIEKTINSKGKSKYYVGILPIYRLQEAAIENNSSQRISVSGSSGITININAGWVYPITDKSKLNLSLGFPTITRHVRPDGLTGTFVISASINSFL
jgi:hypothetical protein